METFWLLAANLLFLTKMSKLQRALDKGIRRDVFLLQQPGVIIGELDHLTAKRRFLFFIPGRRPGNFFLKYRRQLKGQFTDHRCALSRGPRILINAVWINAENIVEEIDNAGAIKTGMLDIEARITILENNELQALVEPGDWHHCHAAIRYWRQRLSSRFQIFEMNREQGAFNQRKICGISP